MGLFPKLLFVLMVLLPGGFVFGPVVLLLKRWHDRRSNKQEQQTATTQPVLSAELPHEPHPLEHRAAA